MGTITIWTKFWGFCGTVQRIWVRFESPVEIRRKWCISRLEIFFEGVTLALFSIYKAHYIYMLLAILRKKRLKQKCLYKVQNCEYNGISAAFKFLPSHSVDTLLNKYQICRRKKDKSTNVYEHFWSPEATLRKAPIILKIQLGLSRFFITCSSRNNQGFYIQFVLFVLFSINLNFPCEFKLICWIYSAGPQPFSAQTHASSETQTKLFT